MGVVAEKVLLLDSVVIRIIKRALFIAIESKQGKTNGQFSSLLRDEREKTFLP
jgi:adenine-specific DNA glycosylase